MGEGPKKRWKQAKQNNKIMKLYTNQLIQSPTVLPNTVYTKNTAPAWASPHAPRHEIIRTSPLAVLGVAVLHMKESNPALPEPRMLSTLVLYHLHNAQEKYLTINIIQYNSLGVLTQNQITLQYTVDFSIVLHHDMHTGPWAKAIPFAFSQGRANPDCLPLYGLPVHYRDFIRFCSTWEFCLDRAKWQILWCWLVRWLVLNACSSF